MSQLNSSSQIQNPSETLEKTESSPSKLRLKQLSDKLTNLQTGLNETQQV